MSVKLPKNTPDTLKRSGERAVVRESKKGNVLGEGAYGIFIAGLATVVGLLAAGIIGPKPEDDTTAKPRTHAEELEELKSCEKRVQILQDQGVKVRSKSLQQIETELQAAKDAMKERCPSVVEADLFDPDKHMNSLREETGIACPNTVGKGLQNSAEMCPDKPIDAQKVDEWMKLSA